MNIDLIKQLISEFEGSNVFKMKIEVEDLKLELEKEPQSGVVNIPTMPTAVKEQTKSQEVSLIEATMQGTPVTSPIVGIFYRSSSPTADAYVEVGSSVKKGQVLCIVEAMKVMNEIRSPMDGVVTAIMANSDELVEFEQVLMSIEG